jgi:hypothetical protein
MFVLCTCVVFSLLISHSAPERGRGALATGSSPTKSVASALFSGSRVGKGISWNIGPFDAGAYLSPL